MQAYLSFDKIFAKTKYHAGGGTWFEEVKCGHGVELVLGGRNFPLPLSKLRPAFPPFVYVVRKVIWLFTTWVYINQCLYQCKLS